MYRSTQSNDGEQHATFLRTHEPASANAGSTPTSSASRTIATTTTGRCGRPSQALLVYLMVCLLPEYTVQREGYLLT